MNLLGYTSTSLLREEQALNAKLRDSNQRLHQINCRLKADLARVNSQLLQQREHGAKLQDVQETNEQLRAENTALNKKLQKISEKYDTQRGRFLECLKEKKEALSRSKHFENMVDKLNSDYSEMELELKQVNDRYDAFVAIASTNFTTHFDRVLKKRKVEELTLD